MSQLNLPHGTNSYKVENRKTKKYLKKTVGPIAYREVGLSVVVRGIRRVSPEEEKEGYGGKDLHKRTVLSLE